LPSRQPRKPRRRIPLICECFCPLVVDSVRRAFYGPAPLARGFETLRDQIPFKRCWVLRMKIKNSLRALRKRHRNNRLVRRRGRLYVINKTNRRFKARQG